MLRMHWWMANKMGLEEKTKEELQKTNERATQLYKDIKKYASEMGLSQKCFDNSKFRKETIKSIESYLVQEQTDALNYSFQGTINLCEKLFASI